MRLRRGAWPTTLPFVAAIGLFLLAAPAQSHPATKSAPKAKPAQKLVTLPLPCGDVLSFQVLLDRQGFSPGQIDGWPGPNFTHALSAMQAVRHLDPTGVPDCDAWHALGGDTSEPTIQTYVLTEGDLEGPFTPHIPRKMSAQATLTRLGYRSPLEELGEKFHASPALLEKMNIRVKLEPGTAISVPAVQPFDATAKPLPAPALSDLTIQVTREDSALRVTDADGSVVFFAPVTTGSEHDPLPIGDWKVLGVRWYPEFHYNPHLFWDAEPGDSRTTIPPGPNNPVGVVWIALSKEHYGLHGTPEPGNIGHTESHGCVRLTNWDAARVAGMVRPGTPVIFR